MKFLGRFSKILVGFVLFMVLAYGGLQWFVHDQVDKGIHEAVARIPGMDVKYSRLDVRIFDQTVTLTEVELSQGAKRIFADKVEFFDFDEKHSMPHHMRMAVQGLVMPADFTHLGALAPLLEALGVLELRGDGALDYAYSPTDKVLLVNDFRFDDKELGNLELSIDLSNVDLDDYRMEKLVGLHIGAGSLRFVDAGLVERIFETYARSRNMSREMAREVMVGELETLAAQARAEDMEQAAQAYAGLAGFLVEPEGILVRTDPEQPVPWMYFFMGRNGAESINLLNLTVEEFAGESDQ